MEEADLRNHVCKTLRTFYERRDLCRLKQKYLNLSKRLGGCSFAVSAAACVVLILFGNELSIQQAAVCLSIISVSAPFLIAAGVLQKRAGI